MEDLKYKHQIIDNIHGLIDLTTLEYKVINMPIFMRLQKIKQLSLANKKFPGAEHTRYVHSLGVMHIAGKMAARLKYTPEEQQLVRLAGLLHDLGHYPLSHVGEKAYMKELKNQQKNIRWSDKNSEGFFLEESRSEVLEAVNGIVKKSKERYVPMKDVKRCHHEELTGNVIESYREEIEGIIKSHYPDTEIITVSNIVNIITGNTKIENLEAISGMIQIIHSEFDADRIDYLMRDATSAGICYGALELETFLSNLTRAKKQGVDIVGVRPKGISALDNLLFNRFFSFKQVVMNKHISIHEAMAAILINYYIGKSDFKEYLIAGWKDVRQKLRENKDEFLNFSDSIFWDLVRSPNSDDCRFISVIKKCFKENTKVGKLVRTDGVVREHIIVERNPSRAMKMLKETETYKDAKKGVKNFYMFKEFQLTSQIPIEEYKEALKPERENAEECEDEVIDKEVRNALMEWGVVWRNEAEDAEYNDCMLLIDDKSSITSCTARTTIYVLREYEIEM